MDRRVTRPRPIAATIVSAALLVGALWAPSIARAAATINVPGDYATIQAAIDAAVAGDTVLVGPGTYSERILIDGKQITVESSGGPGVTMIDGGSAGTTARVNAAAGETPVLRGFTITDGYDGSGPGGVAVNGGPALIEGNVISGNLGCFGGGVGASGSATIRANTITDNGMPCSGGMGAGVGISGIGTVRLLGNTITANKGTAIELNAAGSPTIDGNVVANNTGAAMTMGNQSDAVVSNNLFRDNGGGVSALVPSGAAGPTIVNNTFVSGAASTGSAIFSQGFDSGAVIANNIVVAASAQAAIECPTDYDPAPPQVRYNDVINSAGPAFGDACAGAAGSDGNVSVAPGFIDAAGGNFHLRADSPLIDAGTNGGAPARDFDRDARPFDSDWDGTATVDPGFDEMTDPILVDPAMVDFGDAGIGLAASPRIVTIGNFGADPASVNAVSIDSGDFSISAETCTSGPIAAKGSCTVTIAFTPTALGARNATLTVDGPVPVGARSVAVSGNGIHPPSGLAWGTTYPAGPAYTWNYGGSLGRTVQSGSQRLHLVYATERIGSSWAKDAGPYAGVYYIRSTSGSTWSTPKRVNPSTQHATVVGLAAAGSRVYVVWGSQTRVIKYSPTAPRVLYVRVNTSHGASTAWRSIVRLTSTSGRIDFPSVAASGTDAHVAWTDANTGAIKVASSRNLGVTWKTSAIGTTSLNTPGGRSGVPFVAVSGSTVAVAWLADATGTVKARVSTNRGVSWGPVVTVGIGANSSVSVAVRGSRIAVAWTTADDVLVNLRLAGVWGTAVVVASLSPGAPTSPYGAAVALQDPNRIAVSWAEQRTTAHYVDLRWVESANGGSLWFQPQTVGSASSSSARRANDWPSIVWPSAGKRYVAWSGWTYNTSAFRLFIRAGTGTPVGPSFAAVTWTPAGSDAMPVDDPGKRVAGGALR